MDKQGERWNWNFTRGCNDSHQNKDRRKKMAKCKNCGADVTWLEVMGKRVPVNSYEEITLVQHGDGDRVIICNRLGIQIRGYEVSDAFEGKSHDGRVVHVCNRGI